MPKEQSLVGKKITIPEGTDVFIGKKFIHTTQKKMRAKALAVTAYGRGARVKFNEDGRSVRLSAIIAE